MSALPRAYPQPFQTSRLLVWQPPYRTPLYVDSPRQLGSTNRRGSVLVLRVDGSLAGSEVSRGLSTIARIAPWLSSILVAEESVPPAILLELARRVGFCACDAVLPPAAPGPHILNLLLLGAAVDPEVMVTWAELVRPDVIRLRRELLSYLRGDDALGDHRSLRSALRSAGLPAPTSWRRMMELLPVMLRLQSGRSTVAETAYAAGFADGASLSRAILRLVRLRPIELRGVLGWKWLAYRWLRPAGADRVQRFRPRPLRPLRTPLEEGLRPALAKAV